MKGVKKGCLHLQGSEQSSHFVILAEFRFGISFWKCLDRWKVERKK